MGKEGSEEVDKENGFVGRGNGAEVDIDPIESGVDEKKEMFH